MELIPESLRSEVLSGTLLIQDQSMWYSDNKPVLIDAKTKRLRHGKYINSKNAAVASKESAYKRTKAYKEMKEAYIPAMKGATAEAITSLQEIVEALWLACNGSPQKVTCPDCGSQNVWAFKKDPGALFKFYENIVGKAPETQEITVTNNTLVKMLNDESPLSNIQVIDVTPQQAYERNKLLGGGEDGDGT